MGTVITALELKASSGPSDLELNRWARRPLCKTDSAAAWAVGDLPVAAFDDAPQLLRHVVELGRSV